MRSARAPLVAWLALVSPFAASCDRPEPPPPPPSAQAAPPLRDAPPAFVGAVRCASCHAEQTAQWTGSHHDRAMQEATPATVLGDFSGATFVEHGVTTTFSRDGDAFRVTTEGRDGKPGAFDVAYTFGVDPLQQYLLELPNGRLQALAIAWDARPKERGGQRWFSLQSEPQRISPGDPLHWTELAYNWNSQCAECHSTNLKKGYDLSRDAFETTWSDLDVACEACHGPGSRHVAWAEASPRDAADAMRGLTVRLDDAKTARWIFAEGAPIAHREPPRAAHAQLETCAPCHSRRSPLREGHAAGAPFLDSYRPALLDPGLYTDDGQVLEEVYEYGSFLQSKMHAAGVTCSDCHDPHTLALRAEGNATCTQCHRAETFDVPAHHREKQGSAAAACVACHMPARTFMQLDVRHDHSFRVPGRALEASPIRRASDLAHGADPAVSIDAVQRALGDVDPLLRLGALDAARRIEPAQRVGLLTPLLRDPLRALRLDAAVQLADAPPDLLAPADRNALADALAEYRASQLAIAERPEAHLNLGLLHQRLGEAEAARREYETALRLAPWFVPAYVNLADLERATGREAECEALLRRGLAIAPENPDLHYALGLAIVRTRGAAAALASLARAHALAPTDPGYAYLYAVALRETGDLPRALGVLEAANAERPGERALLLGLATMANQAGRTEDATRWAQALVAAFPDDAHAKALLAQISSSSARSGSRDNASSRR